MSEGYVVVLIVTSHHDSSPAHSEASPRCSSYRRTFSPINCACFRCSIVSFSLCTAVHDWRPRAGTWNFACLFFLAKLTHYYRELVATLTFQISHLVCCNLLTESILSLSKYCGFTFMIEGLNRATSKHRCNPWIRRASRGVLES